jgi:hypothetical protein
MDEIVGKRWKKRGVRGAKYRKSAVKVDLVQSGDYKYRTTKLDLSRFFAGNFAERGLPKSLK